MNITFDQIKKLLALILALVFAVNLHAQTTSEPEKYIRKIADRVILDTSFDFTDTNTGKIYKTAPPPKNARLKPKSPIKS